MKAVAVTKRNIPRKRVKERTDAKVDEEEDGSLIARQPRKGQQGRGTGDEDLSLASNELRKRRKTAATKGKKVEEDAIPDRKQPRKPRQKATSQTDKASEIVEIVVKTKMPSLTAITGKLGLEQVKPRVARELSFPRLGYACLNTVLRKQKPTIFCSRTCRIATIKKDGPDALKELGLQNVRDLEQIILWNEANNIRFFRVSSDLFPFASHLEFGYDLDYAKDDLARIGGLAKSLGHRLTSHVSQFNQLGSPSQKVVASTRRDLRYHAQIFDYMGLDKDSVMILHAGGVFGNKADTLERWGEEYLKLPATVRDRIVLENDDVSYTVRDILPLCQRLSIPQVFDWHHHDILNEFCTGDRLPPSEDKQQTSLDDPEFPQLLVAIEETWTRRGIRQKQHYSQARAGAYTGHERKGHSDRVKNIPVQCDDTIDLMLEAKDKEQAVFDIYKLYGMYDVHPDQSWLAGVETKRVVDRTRKPKKGEECQEPDHSPLAQRKRKTQSLKKEVEAHDVDETNASLSPSVTEVTVENLAMPVGKRTSRSLGRKSNTKEKKLEAPLPKDTQDDVKQPRKSAARKK